MWVNYPIPKELEEKNNKAREYLIRSSEVESNLQFTKVTLKENASEETKLNYKIYQETNEEILKIVKKYDIENDIDYDLE